MMKLLTASMMPVSLYMYAWMYEYSLKKTMNLLNPPRQPVSDGCYLPLTLPPPVPCHLPSSSSSSSFSSSPAQGSFFTKAPAPAPAAIKTAASFSATRPDLDRRLEALA